MKKNVLIMWLIVGSVACMLLGIAIASSYPPEMLTDKELLGKKLYFDPNLSTPKFQSCASCHNPETGWREYGGNTGSGHSNCLIMKE